MIINEQKQKRTS